MKKTKLVAHKGFQKPTLEQVKTKQALKYAKQGKYHGLKRKSNLVGKFAQPKRIKKPKLTPISKLKKQLWKLVSDFIRERDKYICFTSGVKVSGSNAHCGHMYPSSVSGVLLRYHPHNLACQSYIENIHHSGNGAEFYQRALRKYGQEKMDKLKLLKQHSTQGDRYFYTSMIDLYKQGNEEEIVKFLESYI